MPHKTSKYTFFIRNWFIRNYYSAAQKVKKVQYWVFDLSVYKISETILRYIKFTKDYPAYCSRIHSVGFTICSVDCGVSGQGVQPVPVTAHPVPECGMHSRPKLPK